MQPKNRVVRAATLIADLERFRGAVCVACGSALCGHRFLFSIVLGFKSEARCPACLAGALGRELAGLSRHVVAYVQHQECYRTAWEWTSGREGECEMANGTRGTSEDDPDDSVRPERAPRTARGESKGADGERPSAEWDAGEMGCGDLVLELRLRLRAMKPGELLRVTARDPGAPEDLPAWCGMTGHTLVSAKPPVYLIRRKMED